MGRFHHEIIGNSVQIGNGPAAVTGDDPCILPLALEPGRRRERMIRKSEDLPQTYCMAFEDTRPKCCICGEIRAPGSIPIGPGLFLWGLRTFTRKYWRNRMLRNEIAFTKQALLSTKDWDAYQAILHKCLAAPRPP